MMNRPLVAVTFVYVAGILAARFLLEDPFTAYVLMSALVVMGVVAYLWRMVSVSLFMAAALMLVFITGAAAFWFAASPPDGGLLKYTGFPVSVEGTIVEEPRRDEGYTTYRLRVDKVETREGRQVAAGNLQVRVYHQDSWQKPGEEEADKQQVYWFGERLRLDGEIVEPKGRRNPGGFDYRFYLRTQGVDALMYLQPRHVSCLGAGDQWSPLHSGEVSPLASSAFTLRSRMIEGIESSLPSPQAELLAAILFGQRHLLPEDVQENFIRSGTNHLMAVSGLHVGLVAALILGFFRLLRLKGPAAVILAIILICGYAYLTGMRPAALRAALMLSLGFVALLAGREKDFPSAIAFSALVTLIYNPLLLFTIGFQLSYAATLSIFYFYPFLLKEIFYGFPQYLRQLISVTIAAQAGALPLSAYYFHQFPVAALIFNILLLPVMALVVGFGITGGLAYLLWPPLSSVLHLANLPLLSYIVAVSGLAEAPWVYTEINPPGIYILLLYFSVTALGLTAYHRHLRKTEDTAAGKKAEATLNFTVIRGYFSGLIARLRSYAAEISAKQMKGRIITAALLIITIMVWAGAFTAKPEGLTVYFIDVGQGSAAYLETSCGYNMLIDAGGEPPYVDPEKQGQIGEKVILPFLRHKGVDELDLVVITHPHEDHFGGIISVLDHIPVDLMMVSPVPGETDLYEEMLKTVQEKEIKMKEMYKGAAYNPGGRFSMDIILPPSRLYHGTRSDLNNNSVVFRLTYGETDFLFTGDIEEEAVTDLLRQGTDISAHVLLVPHHGGYFESVAPFLEAVSPQIAVIQVGRNPFGHPHPDIINALEDAGVPTYRNDLHGTVIIQTDGQNIQYKTMLPSVRF